MLTPLFYVGRWLSWLLLQLVGRLRVIGREHVPLTGGVVLAANHISYIDPPLVGVAARMRPVHFMGKSELFTLPVLGWLIARVGAFPVKRGTADRQALHRAHEVLTGGGALVIFPEGKRSEDGCLLAPELGVGMIALRAGVPVVPIALIDSDCFLPRHHVGIRFSRVRVVIGEPLTFPHLVGKRADRAALQEVGETVMRRIADLLRAHGAEDRVPAGYLEAKEAVTADAG
jgi:1-acyl-sn-glycerol-3-phosphate acyltransferase